MRIYHRTNDHVAVLIATEGFRDSTGTYLTDQEWTGVWFADQPLDVNEGAWGEVVLMLDIPEDELEQYEWVEEGKGYREFLIPAALANRYGPATVVNADETDNDHW